MSKEEKPNKIPPELKHCPQCGRKRGVTLRRIKYEANVFRRLNEEDKVVYFICCKNCRIRFKIINFGIWDE